MSEWAPFIVLAFAVAFIWSCFFTPPQTYLKSYRRLRGGRWARLSKGWFKMPDEAVERMDEDWRVKR